jgi:hypothetical protein
MESRVSPDAYNTGSFTSVYKCKSSTCFAKTQFHSRPNESLKQALLLRASTE